MHRVKLKLPIKPYLLKFLQEELKAEGRQIEIDGNSFFGAYLMGLIEEVDKPHRPKGEFFVELLVPERDRHGKAYDGQHSHLGISETNINRFNQILEEVFNYRLFYRLEQLELTGQAKRRSGRKKDIIEEMISKYSVREGELTYAMLKMRHDRWKKSGQSLIQTAIGKN